MPRFLAILDGDDIGPTIFSGCAPLQQKEAGNGIGFQNAGNAFFERYERKAGEGRPEKADPESGSDDVEQSPGHKAPKKKKEKKDQEALKLPECLKGEDLYKLLEIDEGVSQEDIKKAWRKICLTAHPDKHGDKNPEELEAVNLRFVTLQEAFNVLNDAKKRRKYDSMGEFDDHVPSRLKEGQDFYEVFGEVFRRNAKWSEHRPVPDLGKPDTPYEKVKAFYDFWFSFESWRNLDALIMEENGEDCFQDLEDAECREEKRWMERENAKLRAPYQKAERQRVFGLTETAEKLDARVRAEKERQNAARDAAKAAKDAKRAEAERLAQEEKERQAAEEEKMREEQRIEKAKREEEKQVKKAARAKLRKRVKDLDLGIFEDQLQEFLLALDTEETDVLFEKLEAGGDGEAVFASMKSKGFEAIIQSKLAEDEKSTTEGSPSEGEVVGPEEAARLERERKMHKKKQEERQKKEQAAQKIKDAEEATKRAEEKAIKDAKKKVEQEKKDREQQKANKKQAEKSKRDEEKKIKDEEKAAEKARAEKEENARRSEELRQKQKSENEAEAQAKVLEARTVEFERDRSSRVDAFEKLEWPAIVEAAKAALEDPMVASALASAAEQYEDPEELIDVQLACLGSFFVLAQRPDPDALPLSSMLRNKVKKHRNRLRNAANTGDLPLEATVEAAADSELLEQFLQAARGERQPPNAQVEAPAAVEEAAASKSKKKAKAKAAPADEDLDALLEEFGVTPTQKKSKKSGKK